MQRHNIRLGLFTGCFLAALFLQGCAAIERQKHFNLGLEYYRAGNYAGAGSHIRAALDSAPENTACRVLLGWIHFKQSRITEAEKLFTSVYSENHADMGALQGLAWVAVARGEPAVARDRFEKTLAAAAKHRLSPYWSDYPAQDTGYILSVFSDAHYGLGLLALARRDYPGAQAHLADALDYRNDFIGHVPIRRALARAYDAAGDYAAAAEVITTLHNGKGDE